MKTNKVFLLIGFIIVIVVNGYFFTNIALADGEDDPEPFSLMDLFDLFADAKQEEIDEDENDDEEIAQAQEVETLDLSCNIQTTTGEDALNPAYVSPFNYFTAYYTQLATGDLTQDPSGNTGAAITGDYADIIITFSNTKRLVFSRGNSYLPVWVTTQGSWNLPELVARSGDGQAQRPDRINRYAHVRIIEANAQRAIIHWRYVPDFTNPTPTGVVHELFTITADGQITREVRIGAETVNDYYAAENNLHQTLQLEDDGILAETAIPTARAQPETNVTPAPANSNPINDAVASWHFDEGINGNTQEDVSGISTAIGGHAALWRTGVSATALEFDGYTSDVTLPAAQAPLIDSDFTIEGWVALSAYPMGLSPILAQADKDGHYAYYITEDDMWWDTLDAEDDPVLQPLSAGGRGYLLGVDARGRIFLMAHIGNEWQYVFTDETIQLRHWTHIAGTYNSTSNLFTIYIDGVAVAQQAVTGSGVNVPAELDLVIGRNTTPQYIELTFAMSQRMLETSYFGFEGLMDEVRLFDRALSATEINSSYQAMQPEANNRDNPDIANRPLPQLETPPASFGATYTTLNYHQSWDNLWRSSGVDDVVVGFDTLPTRINFWRGTSYGPAWVTENNKWMVDQSAEWGDVNGLAEHMSDKQVRYSHVRVLENTPARVIVHWRYAIATPGYDLLAELGELAWVDEYYTIYPDGTTVRSVNDWYCSHLRGEGGSIEWQATMFLAEQGTTPLDTVYDDVATVLNPQGQTGVLNPVAGTDTSQLLTDASMIWLNTRSTYKPFIAFPEDITFFYWTDILTSAWEPTSPDDPNPEFSPFSTGNHWPVAQAPSDGRDTIAADRLTHSEGFVSAKNAARVGNVALYGFTTDSADAIIPVSNAWNHPASVSNVTGATSQGFDKNQNAYLFDGNSDTISFTLNGSANTPIRNPAFVIRNWQGDASPKITVNGQAVSAKFGIHHNAGERTLVIWLEAQSELDLKIAINWTKCYLPLILKTE